MNARVQVCRLLHYSAHALTLNNSFPPLRLTVNSLSSPTLASFRAPSRTRRRAYRAKSFESYLRGTPLLTLRLLKLRMLSPAVNPPDPADTRNPVFRQLAVYFPLCRAGFDPYSLKWWSGMDVFAFAGNTESADRSSDAFDSSGCVWPGPDNT